MNPSCTNTLKYPNREYVRVSERVGNSLFIIDTRSGLNLCLFAIRNGQQFCLCLSVYYHVLKHKEILSRKIILKFLAQK